MNWQTQMTDEEVSIARKKYRQQSATVAPKALGKPYLRTDINGDPIWMKLSFEEWMDIWWESGHWHERGDCTYCYQMCRKNDVGDYALGNVRIGTKKSNAAEAGPSKKQGQNELNVWLNQVTKQGRPCTVDDGITIFASQHQLRKILGCGKKGRNHPNFRYLTEEELQRYCIADSIHLRK